MNYLFGWNPVAEVIKDELKERGIPLDGVLIEDSHMAVAARPTDLPVFSASIIRLSSEDSVFNCLGYKDLMQRIRIGDKLFEIGVLESFISTSAAVHPSAIVGKGSVLVGDVVIERGCSIGKHGLFWGGCRICHDSVLGAGVFLASGAIVGGGCSVGRACSLGFNSSMKEKSAIPEGTQVGANRFWRPSK